MVQTFALDVVSTERALSTGSECLHPISRSCVAEPKWKWVSESRRECLTHSVNESELRLWKSNNQCMTHGVMQVRHTVGQRSTVCVLDVCKRYKES